MPNTGTSAVVSARRGNAATGRLTGVGLLVVALAWLPASLWAAEDFPLRDKYAAVGLAAIETVELAETLSTMTMHDASSTQK